MRQEGVDFIIHYLNDFLLVGVPASQECTGALMALLSACDRLGLPVAREKLDSPGGWLTFLGFERDSMALFIQLLEETLTELRQLIQLWVG